MNSSTIAILTIIASIIGAVIAGLMTMKASKSAAKAAFTYSVSLHNIAQKRAIRGFLKGIQTEITIIKSIYELELKNSKIDITALKEGELFDYDIPLHQNYLTVYESNAALIGQIPDDALISLIIEIYLRIKGLIETHLYNNNLLNEIRNLECLDLNINTFQTRVNLESARKVAGNYGINIKINYVELLEILEEFNPKIESVIQMLTNDINNLMADIADKKTPIIKKSKMPASIEK